MNIIDYLGSEFDSFDERPLGDVDSLVLACLSYYRLPDEARAARTKRGVPLYKVFCAEWFDAMAAGLWDPKGLIQLLTAAVASPRLRGARLCSYVSETDDAEEKQFAACTLRFPSGDAYVSFRGTDNSLVGWKEDFNMAFETDVPSQRAAVAYLERVARGVTGKLYVGGHSKGGNLAVYSAMNCSEQVYARIEKVFSHDGPGFTAEAMASGDFAARVGKVSKTVPESSVIGMMFEQQEEYSVVCSTARGALQHDPFSWVVEGADFVRADKVSRSAVAIDQSINQWFADMSREERAGFIDALFQVLYASGQDTLAGVRGNLSETLPAMAAGFADLTDEQRGFLFRALTGLAKAFTPDLELPSAGGLLATLDPRNAKMMGDPHSPSAN